MIVAITGPSTAALHPERRKVWAGMSTIKAIIANKLAPGRLDRYLTGRL